MNWLDIIIAVVLVLSLVTAFRNGLSGEFVRLLTLVVGIVGGMWWYQSVSIHFRPYIESQPLAEFLAFIAILIGALMAGAVIGWILAKLLGWTRLRWFDRLLGAAFGALRGLAISAALVIAIIAFAPIRGSDETVAASRLAPWVLYGADAAVGLAPEDLKQNFSDGFQRVRTAWIENTPRTAIMP